MIEELGHVGLYVRDLDRMASFYTDVLGLVITDEDLEHGFVFLSARPDVEHHELLLFRSELPSSVQQVSFRCDSLRAVREYERRFRAEGVRIDRVVTHGNAVGVYFFDPEDNRVEVYWQTGRAARQPFSVPIELVDDDDVIVATVDAAVIEYGDTGRLPDYVDPSAVGSARP